jgi:hypothetical protein
MTAPALAPEILNSYTVSYYADGCHSSFQSVTTPLSEAKKSLDNMSNQSQSSRFLELFESALLGYEKTTNITLAKHPLAKQLQDCHSVESVTTFLQDQAREFGHFRESDKIMNSIKHTVSILCILSDTLTLSSSVHLVCPRPPRGLFQR